jgi:hypothetical protein
MDPTQLQPVQKEGIQVLPFLFSSGAATVK